MLYIDNIDGEIQSVIVYDMSGTAIQIHNSVPANNSINVSEILPGTYILQIETEQETISQSFIKQ